MDTIGSNLLRAEYPALLDYSQVNYLELHPHVGFLPLFNFYLCMYDGKKNINDFFLSYLHCLQ